MLIPLVPCLFFLIRPIFSLESASNKSLAAASETLLAPHLATISRIAMSMNRGFLEEVVTWVLRNFSEALSLDLSIWLPSMFRSFDGRSAIGI